jgi:hypothetical protein
MFLMMSWKRQVLNVAYKIKITIPERIGKIYTMSDRETGIDENVMMAYFKRSNISVVAVFIVEYVCVSKR